MLYDMTAEEAYERDLEDERRRERDDLERLDHGI